MSRRQGCCGRAAGIVTRMCRDAAGGSVARAFASRAIEPDRPRTSSEGGAALTSSPTNSRLNSKRQSTQDAPRAANNVFRLNGTKVSAVKPGGRAAHEEELVRPQDTAALPLRQGALS